MGMADARIVLSTWRVSDILGFDVVSTGAAVQDCVELLREA